MIRGSWFNSCGKPHKPQSIVANISSVARVVLTSLKCNAAVSDCAWPGVHSAVLSPSVCPRGALFLVCARSIGLD